jgi:hypothetical protein
MSDDRLRARFERLRAEDQAHAPPFSAPEPLAERSWAPVFWWMAAAAVALLTVSVALGGRKQDEALVASLSEWRSPTAALLRTSGQELFRSPSISSSVLP